MTKLHVSTTINGEPAEFLCEPNDTMLDALRGPLGLTGSKEGCASGDCGACSITLDDRLVCSCLMLACEAEGHQLRTIEGMAHGDKLHPLQQKFLEMAALQCGICTSGMLVASDALRGSLGLTGSKEGCASGDCGACSITLDDRLVCSCLMLAVEAEGHEIRTIEGMAEGDHLHPLQQKFLELAALQCGICTSGMLVASDALLRKNPRPSEEEVRFWLAGNLCRCTGYDKIVRAVMETAQEMQDMREAAQ
jgi:aerobic carbon-monoxide dehydrogenase small subunit